MKVCLIGFKQRPPAAQMPPIINPLAKPPAPRTCPSTPPRGEYKTPNQSSNQNPIINHSEITSKLDGHSLGEMMQVWREDHSVSKAGSKVREEEIGSQTQEEDPPPGRGV